MKKQSPKTNAPKVATVLSVTPLPRITSRCKRFSTIQNGNFTNPTALYLHRRLYADGTLASLFVSRICRLVPGSTCWQN